MKKNKTQTTLEQEKTSKKKMIQITSTQSFSPIRDVCDGIIVTKTGDFVKIMEISPINFALRSKMPRPLQPSVTVIRENRSPSVRKSI